MSISGGVMTNAALDAALDNLGMLSTGINRPHVVDGQIPRLAALSIDDILQNPEMGSNAVSNCEKETFAIEKGFAVSPSKIALKPMRKRNRTGDLPTLRTRLRMHPYGTAETHWNLQRRSRTRSENESELLDHLSQCSSHPQSNIDPVPYIAFPLDGKLSCNLFKSRSMESIDARTSSESVDTSQNDPVLITNARFGEVDAVLGGLHKLNVSE